MKVCTDIKVLIICLMRKVEVRVVLIKEFVNGGIGARLLHIRQAECKVNSHLPSGCSAYESLNADLRYGADIVALILNQICKQ